ncbi:lysoplasmalogenase [Novosphingobium sp. Chol11]|uniref:lysoplasmalogenase n=1 Tax=Novosphingobium sp. Chol11 TaxID=1385763 RepID=UPI0025E81AAB|nr:lysoplasmalogenase [Novosphingobium sp. Chol11]
MAGLALSERRPWLLASLVFGISYWFAGPNTVPGVYLIAWKGAGVGLLAAYAWAHHPSRGAHLIALMLALGAIGDMVLEIDFVGGALAFLAGHLVAIGLYTSHRRPNADVAVPLALVAAIPVAAYLLTGAASVSLYALGLGGMTAAAWRSDFPRSRVGLGAIMFAASDLLIFARMGPLAGSAIPDLLVWPLYYFGQLLICVGGIRTLRQHGEFSADQPATGSATAPSAERSSGP